MKTKTAEQLIAEIDQEHADIQQLVAEQDAQSAKMLARMFADLNRTAVSERYNGPDIKLVAGKGPDFVVERYEKILCRVSGHFGGVRVVRHQNPKAEDFMDFDAALKSVLRLLHEDWLQRPHDTRDPLQKLYKRYQPA
jgi:hypothetical protein